MYPPLKYCQFWNTLGSGKGPLIYRALEDQIFQFEGQTSLSTLVFSLKTYCQSFPLRKCIFD